MQYKTTKERLAILKKYGIKRYKQDNKSLRSGKKKILRELHKEQRGVCYLTGYKHTLKDSSLHHLIPYATLRKMGFDPRERWSKEILVATTLEANGLRGQKLEVYRDSSLVQRYLNCAKELQRLY